MDRNAFDGLTKLLATTPNRRAALGALLGAGFFGVAGIADAAKKDREKRRVSKKGKGTAQVSTQTACASPGPGSNLSGCNFDHATFSGDDLSGSKMVATTLRRALLIRTDLSSSNARNAVFRDADLCGANLRSSTLRDANFRNADLTLANLSSSACAGADFVGAVLCQTRMCSGTVRSDACPDTDPGAVCCADADCSPGQSCVDGKCASCPEGTVELGNGGCALRCATHEFCQERGGAECGCVLPVSAPPVCARVDNLRPCTQDAGCLPGEACHAGRCQSLCGLPGN